MKTLKILVVIAFWLLHKPANTATYQNRLEMPLLMENIPSGFIQTGIVKSIIMDSNTDLDHSGIKEKIILQRPFRPGIR